jgi:2-polyprenyl-6-methoxyphenol hydroxylase-like FAD-dependent oxidoreductase
MGTVSQPCIAIIGGSLVGPATELLLRRTGFTDVTTYEALPAARSQSGGVMGLRQGTLDLLEFIGVSADDVEALTDRNVYAWDLTPQGLGLRGISLFPGRTTSWDALHAALRERVDVNTGRRLVDLQATQAGQWELTFAKGEDVTADIVIFADGRKSLGRELLDPDRPLQYNGYVTWRGLVDPPDPKPRGFERYYDVKHGRLFSITEPLKQSGKTYWELSHNLSADEYEIIVGARPEEHAFVLPNQVTPAIRDVVRRAAHRLPAMFQELIEGSEVAGIPVNDLTMPTHAVFHPHGRAASHPAVLLGDALVPVRLQVGAGLNHGLQQAYDLARAFGSATPCMNLRCWEENALARLAPIVELGRSRAHKANLGTYIPVQPGRTAAPLGDQWGDPEWVNA